MKRHQVALIIALTLLAAVASTSLARRGLAAAGSTPSLSARTFAAADFAAADFAAADDVLSSALRAATLVVRARVEQVVSRWADDRSHLQSESTLTPHYVLRGAVDGPLVVHTIGGYLPAENLAMIDAEAPTLTVGEEVILLLAPAHGGYAIVGRLDGKYTVVGQKVYSAGAYDGVALDVFYARLSQLAPDMTAPEGWAGLEANLQTVAPVQAADFVYNERKWPSALVPFYVNLNSSRMDAGNGASDDFRSAILNAALTWGLVESADFTLEYAGATTATTSAYDHTNNIFFIDKGLVDSNGVRQPLATATVWFTNGIILDADIAINDAYPWDATGNPDRSEVDLESVTAHELGHWLSLGHDPDGRAVMYYAITTGTLKRALFDNDRRGIEFIYPCAAGQVCNPMATPTPTPTATPTPTPTATPTATFTATPTAIPTMAPTPTPVTQLVTHEGGGVVEYAPDANSHIALLVPPNAVEGDTVVTIELTSAAPAPPVNHHPVMNYFRVHAGPLGMEQSATFFHLPVTLTVTYSAVSGSSSGESLCLLALDEGSQRWAELACESAAEDSDTQRVIATIQQPSIYGLFRIDNTLYLPLTQRSR